MKFDLTKFKAGHPAKTKTGIPVKFVYHYEGLQENPGLVVLFMGHNAELKIYWENGLFESGFTSRLDLVLI